MDLIRLQNGCVGPFDHYCDGYGNPGADGLGYVSVLKLATGAVALPMDEVLDGIVAYDRAEANTAYIGQINMETASSFCGLAGSVWGYDFAVADAIHSGSLQPLFTVEQYNGSPLPVYDAQPLLGAGEALFGVERQRRFPPIPGGHVICANKSVTQRGRGRVDGAEAFAVWCYIAISITRDRDNSADLFIEDAGVYTANDGPDDPAAVEAWLDRHRRKVVDSIVLCGQDQRVVYKETYISFAFRMLEERVVGTALTCAPYVVLARKAVPPEGVDALRRLTLSQWEQELGLVPLPDSPR